MSDNDLTDSSSAVPTPLLEKHRWLAYVLPLAVYMLAGALEPSPGATGRTVLGFTLSYPVIYTAKIILTLIALAWVFPVYRQFRGRPGVLAVAVGAVGIVVWVGLWEITRQTGLSPLLDELGKKLGSGGRPEFNPLKDLGASPAWAWTFLAIRFFGLVAVVPVIEEFFLRAFLMRVILAPDWWKVPFGQVTAAAAAVSIGYGVLMHPLTEMLAAAAWFGLVTWLMARTRNPWDCVVAHAVTNLLLGVYVVVTGTWALW